MTTSYQLAVIGSGAAGREAAILAARNGLRVALIEQNGLGGTSFHRGYYAVRAFLACAEASRQSAGVTSPNAHSGHELAEWLGTRARVTARLVRELQTTLDRLGIAIRFGHGSLLDANTIRIETDSGRTDLLHADYIMIATGSRPSLDGKDLGPAFVNIDQFLNRSSFPQRLLIVGGGYIGCEIASILQSLGCRVTLLEKSHLLPDFDEFISAFISRTLLDSGVSLHFGHEVDLKHPGGTREEPSFALGGGLGVSADLVLVSIGRKPNIEGLELEPLGVDAAPFIRVNDYLQATLPHVFAIGDVNGLGSMDSLAVAQARIAVAKILGKHTPYAPRWVPKCVYTNPMVASVGLTEEEAGREGLAAILVTEDERSVLEPSRLMLKILVDSESRQILGLHAIGRHAAALVNTAALAISSGITIDQLSEIIFLHPSPVEAIQSFSSGLRSLRDG
jgi:pyruvate/2-oxoglutarate dehydrogenase complex dihydrolipoamide dehydrogenase (E3) component